MCHARLQTNQQFHQLFFNAEVIWRHSRSGPTEYKIATLMHHTYNNTAPTYLCDLISFSSTRSLRSTTNGAAAVSRTSTRRDWMTVPSPLLAQEFGTICQPLYDKLFPLLLSKDSWRFICIVVRLIAMFSVMSHVSGCDVAISSVDF